MAELNTAIEAKREEGRALKHETYADIENYPTYEQILRDLQLQILDQQWKGHLHTMDQLRNSVNMRAYAQRDPKLEYQREGFALFGEMEQRIDDTFAEFALRFNYPRPNLGPQATSRRVEPGAKASEASARSQGTPPGAVAQAAGGLAGGPAGAAGAGAAGGAPQKVGRNEPCPCGSGKKYKKCHGA
jgi:preprotein translocase subunit SecA